MGVTAFPPPFVHRVARRCRACGSNVTVYLLGGASCARDPYYTCGLCLVAPEAFPDRLPELVGELETPQLELVECPPSERTETLGDQLKPKNERAGLEAGSTETFGRGTGEPIEAGGRPQPKGGR